MKNLFITLLLMSWTLITVQAQTDYKQWETHRFRVKIGQEADFENALAAHNKKFHNAAPYKTGIFQVHTGPNSGDYELAIGPMTFTQLEGRPAGEAHDSDWAKVMEHVASTGESVYWRSDKDIMYTPASGTDGFNTNRWRYFTILPGERDRFEGLLKQVAEVYTAKKYAASFTVYWKWGASAGPHACTEIGMKSLAYFDQANTFEKDFEEVHGFGSLSKFYEEFELCVDRTKTYDEIVEFMPDLSSDY
jgi:hypothetical protein